METTYVRRLGKPPAKLIRKDDAGNFITNKGLIPKCDAPMYYIYTDDNSEYFDHYDHLMKQLQELKEKQYTIFEHKDALVASIPLKKLSDHVS